MAYFVEPRCIVNMSPDCHIGLKSFVHPNKKTSFSGFDGTKTQKPKEIPLRWSKPIDMQTGFGEFKLVIDEQ